MYHVYLLYEIFISFITFIVRTQNKSKYVLNSKIEVIVTCVLQ